MIVISAGMQKSGSGYLYNLLNDLEIVAGNSDARQIKKKYDLESLMKWDNNNIGKISLQSIIRLSIISFLENSFVVKTHAPPTLCASILSRLGLIKIIYCYRDPRDCLLSAIDHGKQLIESGDKDHPFTRMTDIDQSIPIVKNWLSTWEKYRKLSSVLMIRYEDLLEDPINMLRKIEIFLGLKVDENTREKILLKYSKNNPTVNKSSLHLNKAKSYRYKNEMSNQQKEKLKFEFSDYLFRMGYQL